jgi:hypothetical protein
MEARTGMEDILRLGTRTFCCVLKFVSASIDYQRNGAVTVQDPSG